MPKKRYRRVKPIPEHMRGPNPHLYAQHIPASPLGRERPLNLETLVSLQSVARDLGLPTYSNTPRQLSAIIHHLAKPGSNVLKNPPILHPDPGYHFRTRRDKAAETWRRNHNFQAQTTSIALSNERSRALERRKKRASQKNFAQYWDPVNMARREGVAKD